jgi:hypothetical protein
MIKADRVMRVIENDIAKKIEQTKNASDIHFQKAIKVLS